MAHEKTDTETLMLSVIEEYSHSDMALGPQVRSRSKGTEDQKIKSTLLIMAHAHLHSAMALMKQAGLTPHDVAEDFYIHADIQAAKGLGA